MRCSGAEVLFCESASSPGTMATDSWALAVDEQEAAVKSVSGFSFRREKAGDGEHKQTLLQIQGAPRMHRPVAHRGISPTLLLERLISNFFSSSKPVRDFYPVANLS